MKIFTSSQIKEIDRYTIENEPVESIQLMERAAGKLFDWIVKRFARSDMFMIFTGPGNNGGDGLVLARLLHEAGYNTGVFHLSFTDKVSPDWQNSFNKLKERGYKSFKELRTEADFPVLNDGQIVIDAIFGSGLTRPAADISAETIRYINTSGCQVVSIDMPSGLFGEDNTGNISENIIHATCTLTFEFAKLAMMFPENHQFTGEWHVLPIGLHPGKISETDTPYHIINVSDIAPLVHRRNKFDHKGLYGHGLLVAGSKDKAGAAVLSARAALRTGIGLLTCHTASQACPVIQSAVPETMISPDADENIISEVRDTEPFTAVGAGPGIGVADSTVVAIVRMLEKCSKPVVIDADAINILASDKSRLNLLREGIIITPHLKEFERIAGQTADGYSRLKTQIGFSETHKCIVVLKGAHTSVSLPGGKVFFNSTGNPGMATGGSGDVLTGIILSLLAQEYSPGDAAKTGVFLHGLAGDIASESLPFESIIASDIIENIGKAFKRIKEHIGH